MPGAALSLSANGNDDSSAIIWASLPVARNALVHIVPGVLRAFEAAPRVPRACDPAHHCELRQIWSSLDEPKFKEFNFAKFAAPTVANGKVFLPTFSNRVNVYGIKTSAAH